MLNPVTMRLFWDSVHQAPPQQIHSLDDEGLMSWLVDQVMQRSILDSHQRNDLCQYISGRLLLVREIAAES